jgi:hypothetical protein
MRGTGRCPGRAALGRLSERFLDRRFRQLADVDAGRTHLGGHAVECCARNQIAIERDRAGRIVVAGDRVVDAVRRGIAVEHRDHRDAELARLEDGEFFLVRVDHEQKVRHAAHLADSAERFLQLLLLALEPEPFLLGQALGTRVELLVDRLEARDRVGHGLPVGQRAAEPAMVHVVLGRALGRFRDRLRGLALGADEEDAAALRDGLAHRLQRRIEQRHGLGQVDDVDAVARAVDIRPHARVPAVGLVAEVHARFEKLAQCKLWQSHGDSPFSGFAAAGRRASRPNRWTPGDVSPGAPRPRLWIWWTGVTPIAPPLQGRAHAPARSETNRGTVSVAGP